MPTAERIRAVEAILGYEFNDKALLRKALEAAGATMAREGNKPLALIGDAILRLVLYELHYEDEASIHIMTKAQNTRATNENLAQIGFSLGIDAYIQLNPSSQGVVNERLMATTMEAIMGAVYLDSGKNAMTTRLVVIRLRVLGTL
ncbi:uncharacterized protein N7503_010719 [Penicillium pulvis]|uniref:uncharacterized protein n=1 Tax=Penicillium pulvis TaxID=1562058 RepID=UPI00254902E0|nr:uncharacterized protein N7503_010719 [Penicillium pulvis]KAJ5785507.1 hypothetical protein N7503_010719 [Penicillium pulvis]